MLKSSSRRNEFDIGFCASLLTVSLILATTSADTLWVPYLSSQYIVHRRYICLTLNAGHILFLICSRVFLLFCGMIRKSTACLMYFSPSQAAPACSSLVSVIHFSSTQSPDFTYSPFEKVQHSRRRSILLNNCTLMKEKT
uniref:Uncharacterized protein n=1 Tax=Arundo donax TaxID=35708 RepID=A0A0A9DM60_ARUDO